MSNMCHFEAYVPHYTLQNDAEVRYWNLYIEKVLPILQNDMSKTAEDIRNELMPQYRGCLYSSEIYEIEDNNHFIYNDEIKYNYLIPDQYILCFNPDEITKSITKEQYENATEDEKENFKSCLKCIKLKTTAKNARERLEKRLQIQEKNEIEKDYIAFGQNVLDWVKKFHDDTRLVLSSGDTLFDLSIQCFVNYNPFDGYEELIEKTS